MFVTPFGRTIFFNAVQLENASFPMLVTPSGIVILSSPLQYEKVPSAIPVSYTHLDVYKRQLQY